jgi:hypothetical protein
MEFTSDEEKMIASLRRQHQGWRTTRAITLASSVACAAFAAFEFYACGFGALPLLLLVIGTGGASFTLGSWAGRAEVSLLLKLVESARGRGQA